MEDTNNYSSSSPDQHLMTRLFSILEQLQEGADNPPQSNSFANSTSQYLDLPEDNKQWLLSPPCSPRLGWKPSTEGLNKIPSLDLPPVRIGNENVLLPAKEGFPKITLTLEEEVFQKR